MKPHKHAELIKAWADGAEIEYWSEFKQMWRYERKPAWNECTAYRIKPTPKPDIVIKRSFSYVEVEENYYLDTSTEGDQMVRFTFDGETGKLKSVEMI